MTIGSNEQSTLYGFSDVQCEMFTGNERADVEQGGLYSSR